jgi:tripartite-type tricarboxylate transporter receptor subunit TctC
MRRTGQTVLVVLVFLGILSVNLLSGAEYPTKPIEVLVPYTPGSSMDIVARVVGDVLPKYLGQPMIVTNKPGAGGSLAAAEVISTRPDGYKLCMLAQVFFATTVRTQKIPFDPNNLVPLYNFME